MVFVRIKVSHLLLDEVKHVILVPDIKAFFIKAATSYEPNNKDLLLLWSVISKYPTRERVIIRLRPCIGLT